MEKKLRELIAKDDVLDILDALTPEDADVNHPAHVAYNQVAALAEKRPADLIQPIAPNVPLDEHEHMPGQFCVGCAELMGWKRGTQSVRSGLFFNDSVEGLPKMSESVFKKRAEEENGQIVSVCNLPTLNLQGTEFVKRDDVLAALRAERPQLSAEQPSGATYGKEVSKCWCGTETQWLYNGVPTCWDCLGDKPAPPVLQAEPLPERHDEDYGIVAREFFKHYHIPFKHEVCGQCQQVEQLIKLLKTIDDDIRREAEAKGYHEGAKFLVETNKDNYLAGERAAFEKAADEVDEFCGPGHEEIGDHIRALADSPINGDAATTLKRTKGSD